MFDQVQELLKTNRVTRITQRHNNETLLSGILFDDRGNRMSPSYTTKKGVRYPFYVSAAILKGRKGNAGSVARISATEIEALIGATLRNTIDASGNEALPTMSILVERYLERAIISATKLTLTLKSNRPAVEIPWSTTKKRDLFSVDDTCAKPSNTPNAQLLQAVVRAHTWIQRLTEGTYESVEALARASSIHPKVIRNSIRLAFLAPDITAAILAGEQPHNLCLGDFKKDIPLAWSAQRTTFNKVALSNR